MAKIEDLRIDQPVPRPRRRTPNFWPWLILAAVVAGWFIFRGGLKLPAASDMKQLVGQAREVEVFTVPSQASGPPGSISAGGYLEVIPPGPQLVSALIPGMVSEMRAVPGQHVEAGELLGRIDDSLLLREASLRSSDVELAASRLASVRAGFRSQEIKQAEAALRSSEARSAKADADLARMEELYSKGVISMSELESFRSEAAQARQDVLSKQSAVSLLRSGARPEEIGIAEAELQAARARLDEVNFRISQCSIKAPQSGTVFEQLAQVGDWLSASDGGPDGAALVSLIDPRQIQAYVDVNQRDSESISPGQRVKISTDAQPGREISGSVSSIMPKANLQKNTVQVKISIADPPADLLPGLSVKVTFLPLDQPEEEQKKVLGTALPAGALLSKDGASGVFVIEGELARWRQVELEDPQNTQQPVALSGIGAGDQVILSPQGLSDGQKVKIKAAEQPSE
ncbi:efflux RND transporter periplasmic adaptor subunit [bacterium]|nr:efflux RND transporter periplasmic adaptor subunit [bacterium]